MEEGAGAGEHSCSEQLSSHVSSSVKSGVDTAFIQEPEKKPQESVIQEREQG